MNFYVYKRYLKTPYFLTFLFFSFFCYLFFLGLIFFSYLKEVYSLGLSPSFFDFILIAFQDISTAVYVFPLINLVVIGMFISTFYSNYLFYIRLEKKLFTFFLSIIVYTSILQIFIIIMIILIFSIANGFSFLTKDINRTFIIDLYEISIVHKSNYLLSVIHMVLTNTMYFVFLGLIYFIGIILSKKMTIAFAISILFIISQSLIYLYKLSYSWWVLFPINQYIYSEYSFNLTINILYFIILLLIFQSIAYFSFIKKRYEQ